MLGVWQEKSAVRGGDTMKAYIIQDLKGYADYSTVVFAETSGKAKAIAIHTDSFEDYEFTEISARRVKVVTRTVQRLTQQNNWRVLGVEVTTFCSQLGECKCL